MSDQPENLMLAVLRRLDTKMDRVLEEIQDLKLRMTTVEIQVSQQVSTESSHYVSLATRLDRIKGRLDRLERQADVVPA